MSAQDCLDRCDRQKQVQWIIKKWSEAIFVVESGRLVIQRVHLNRVDAESRGYDKGSLKSIEQQPLPQTLPLSRLVHR